MLFRQIFDEKLAQYAYLIGCQATGEAIIIDPERDIDVYLRLAQKDNLNIVAAVDTHIHADYISGLREFAERGVKVYASDEGDEDWKYEWLIGSQYEYQLLHDGDTFGVGNIGFRAVYSPGHTPEHLSYLVTDHGGGADAPMGLISGDFVFVGDLGRPDLLESAAGVVGVMEPSARALYHSVQRFLKLEDYLQVWPAHGAGSACGKALGAVPETTVGYERRFNGAIAAAMRGEDEFVEAILDGQPEPPMYFARMKRDNKIGPRVLGDLPNPHPLSPRELGQLAGRTDVAVIDARIDRTGFMAGHLPGSICIPFNKAFNTVAGSFFEEDMPIYLIIDDAHVDAAVRDLIRIGLDHIIAYATPETLEAYREQGGRVEQLESIDMTTLDAVRARPDVSVLDVRSGALHAVSHVPGSVNIADSRMWVRRADVPTGGTLAVYCTSGARSACCASLLKRLGHEVIYVNGTYADWQLMNPQEPAIA